MKFPQDAELFVRSNRIHDGAQGDELTRPYLEVNPIPCLGQGSVWCGERCDVAVFNATGATCSAARLCRALVTQSFGLLSSRTGRSARRAHKLELTDRDIIRTTRQGGGVAEVGQGMIAPIT